ncbi:Myosin phosphatase Rho-interacting protein [Anabarilius grahami]|uniref:Myosin phosphatase Rho-interacting protein n=1 Tax=Anabarilius grahami TaxID=495550 RepID=A0A3N0Y0C4_ANAGA|nr:Myosin phosphatase Rho-interacting protein [Anabarilius grahami]
MCGGKRRGVPLLSRLRGSHAGVTAVFCFASIPPPLPKRKEAKFGPQAKPIYGGWLCLAPEGTDFDNPMQRSRKWQRRFFVLYEHGCLRFALDESTLDSRCLRFFARLLTTGMPIRAGQFIILLCNMRQKAICLAGVTSLCEMAEGGHCFYFQ